MLSSIGFSREETPTKADSPLEFQQTKPAPASEKVNRTRLESVQTELTSRSCGRSGLYSDWYHLSHSDVARMETWADCNVPIRAGALLKMIKFLLFIL